jgi:hypothetical protein
MVLTVSFVLSPATGLFCHRRRRNYFRQLDASVGASGPHDFAVRLKRRSSCVAKASTASRPTSVTIASAPQEERDGGSPKSDLGEVRIGIFLRKGMDRFSCAAIDLPVGQNHARYRVAEMYHIMEH